MKDIQLLKHYVVKLFIVMADVFTSPVKLPVVVLVVGISELSDGQKALILLAGLFVIDFVTGIMASWVEFSKEVAENPNNGPKRYLIQSQKLKMSAVKFTVYGSVILVAAGIQWAFVKPEVTFRPHDSLNGLTLTTTSIAILSIVEAYSIVFENVKRMGFDLIQKIKAIAGKVSEVKKIITK